MFSSISSWILSIAGVISISVIVELILPEGSLNKYIRSIFSFVVVLVIIAPLPGLVGKNFDFSQISIEEEYTLQEDYLFQLNVYKTEALQTQLANDIEQAGYENVKVSVSCENYSTNFTITAIYVELQNLVILDKAEHTNIIDIEEEILSLIKSRVDVEKGRVHFER